MSAAGAVIAKQKQIVRRFERANATDAARAVTPESMEVRQSLVFRKLAGRGVLVPVEGGKFYLDLKAYAAWRKRRRLLVSLFMGAIAVGGGIAVVFKLFQ